MILVFLIKLIKKWKLDDFMEYTVLLIRWFQGIYMQLDDFNKFVNEEILLVDFSFFAIRWFQGIEN